METVINKLLELLAAFGVGVVFVLGVGFWLFYKIKREGDERKKRTRPLPLTTPDPTWIRSPSNATATPS